MWSTGEGNGKPLQYSCLENSMNIMKRQKEMTLKDEAPSTVGVQILLGKSREMKMLSQSGNDTQLWLYLVMKVKSYAVKNAIA